MTNTLDLLTPVRVGPYELPNRIVMAPLTRMRAGEGFVPVPMNASYYAQRASAGLIISEATQVSQQGQGYPNTPGLYTEAQVEGWRLVTEAVHQRGGRIFLQLWHVGRISHPEFQPDESAPVAPSAIKPAGEVYTPSGSHPYVTPRALSLEEIPMIVDQFQQGARRAMAAGFDGVEIHSANGYLLDQFLRDSTNQRTDAYGGSIANRARLLQEVTEAVIDIWGSERVGIRLSPSGTFNDISDSDPVATFSWVVERLNEYDLAYLHLVEPRVDGFSQTDPEHDLSTHYFRGLYNGSLIGAGGYTRETGNEVLANGDADLIAYGRLFIANPDLPLRFKLNATLNTPDRSTFYGGTEKGYLDYPALEADRVA